MLRVAVSSAVNLPNVETIGKSDPYVVLNFQGLYCCVFVRFHIAWRWGERVNNNNIQHVKHSLNIKLVAIFKKKIFLGAKKKTEVIKDELNPVWNEVSCRL